MSQVRMVSVSEARSHLAGLIARVNAEQSTYYILSNSKPAAVLISPDAYNLLVEQIEELSDSLDILQARLEDEPSRPFGEFAQEQAAAPAPHV